MQYKWAAFFNDCSADMIAPGIPAIIAATGEVIFRQLFVILRQFEMLGSYPLNESVAIARARDKLRSMQLLARQGIDLPVTG
ncbi:hypothetical protein ACSLOI_28580, partial [Escherichia coli]